MICIIRVSRLFVAASLATRQAVSQFRVNPAKKGGVYALAYDIMTGACFCGGSNGVVSKWVRRRQAPSPSKSKVSKQTWREKSAQQTFSWQRDEVVHRAIRRAIDRAIRRSLRGRLGGRLTGQLRKRLGEQIVRSKERGWLPCSIHWLLSLLATHRTRSSERTCVLTQ